MSKENFQPQPEENEDYIAELIPELVGQDYSIDPVGFYRPLQEGKARPIELDEGEVVVDNLDLALKRKENRERTQNLNRKK